MPDAPEEVDGPVDPEQTVDRRDPPSNQEITDEISAEILRIHEESYGKGAQSAQTFLSDDYVVVVLDDLELLPNEKFLVENGKRDSVTHVRAQYQFAIQSSFRAAVERATGRTVIGFASANNVEDPAFATEIFKLG